MDETFIQRLNRLEKEVEELKALLKMKKKALKAHQVAHQEYNNSLLDPKA